MINCQKSSQNNLLFCTADSFAVIFVGAAFKTIDSPAYIWKADPNERNFANLQNEMLPDRITFHAYRSFSHGRFCSVSYCVSAHSAPVYLLVGIVHNFKWLEISCARANGLSRWAFHMIWCSNFTGNTSYLSYSCLCLQTKCPASFPTVNRLSSHLVGFFLLCCSRPFYRLYA